MDFGPRDVAVVDVSGDHPALYRTLARIPSADLPAPGSVEATVQRGKVLFNSAIGPSGTAANSLPPAGRLSDFGWGACYSSGLPIGVQFGARFGDEATLFRLAAQLEQARPWARRLPPLLART